ncbi:MAG: ribbon-helix-helix domain-containing protein [Candidatus Bathyarchaeia archaeon]
MKKLVFGIGVRLKTLRVSDGAHAKLTALLGMLTAQTGKMQTYEDAIEALLSKSVTLPPELLKQVEGFIDKNKQLGHPTKEEFVRDAIRFRLTWLSEENECIIISKEKSEMFKRALKELRLPYTNVQAFINSRIKEVLEEYIRFKKKSS